MTTPIAYCEAGHLLNQEAKVQCHQCALDDKSTENERIITLIEEIEVALPSRGSRVAWQKLELLKRMFEPEYM